MQIQGIIVGLVIALIGFALFGTYAAASDAIYRVFTSHCANGDQTTLKMVAQTAGGGYVAGERVSVTANGAGCQISDPAATAADGSVTFKTENEETVTVTVAAAGTPKSTLGTDWKWTAPAGVLNRFASINRLMAQLMPLLIAVGFLSVGYMVARNYSGGSISTVVTGEVMGLIVVVVSAFLLPVLVDFVVTAGETTDGRLTVTGRFSTIINLLLSAVPLVYNLSVIGLTVKSGIRGIQGGGAPAMAGF